MATPSHDQLLFDQVGGSIMGCSFFFKSTLNSFTGNSSLSANNL
jgi:hypothetical protein